MVDQRRPCTAMTMEMQPRIVFNLCPSHLSAPTPWFTEDMKHVIAPLLALLLAGCQLYAGSGTLVSDGRTTTIRSSSVEASPERGIVSERRRTDIRSEPLY